jgi:putative AlgH/UPF0301 family transcriptional regulator
MKALKCGGCGAVCVDVKAFQAHCGEIEQNYDFGGRSTTPANCRSAGYEYEDVMCEDVIGGVKHETEERAKEGDMGGGETGDEALAARIMRLKREVYDVLEQEEVNYEKTPVGGGGQDESQEEEEEEQQQQEEEEEEEQPKQEAYERATQKKVLAQEVEDSEALQCRICLESDTPVNLLAPCSCKGTAQYVHHECLNTWRQTDPRRSARCNICNVNYTVPLPWRARFVKWIHRARWVGIFCFFQWLMWMNSTSITMLANGQLALIAMGDPVPELQEGSLLVATKQIKLGMFHKSVLLLTKHTVLGGAQGFILNKAYADQHHHPGKQDNPGRTMYGLGGPVAMRSFFSFHNQRRVPSSLQVLNGSKARSVGSEARSAHAGETTGQSDPVYLFNGELSWAEVVNASEGGTPTRLSTLRKYIPAGLFGKPFKAGSAAQQVSATDEKGGVEEDEGGELPPLEPTPELLPTLAVLSGYAAWSAQQLEGEVRRGDWVIVPAATSDHVFHVFTKLHANRRRRWRDGEKGEAFWEVMHSKAQSFAIQGLKSSTAVAAAAAAAGARLTEEELLRAAVGGVAESGEWRRESGSMSSGNMAAAVAAAGAGGAIGAAAAAAGEGGTAEVAAVAVAAAAGAGGVAGAVAGAAAAAAVGFVAAAADLGVTVAAVAGAAAATGAARAMTHSVAEEAVMKATAVITRLGTALTGEVGGGAHRVGLEAEMEVDHGESGVGGEGGEQDGEEMMAIRRLQQEERRAKKELEQSQEELLRRTERQRMSAGRLWHHADAIYSYTGKASSGAFTVSVDDARTALWVCAGACPVFIIARAPRVMIASAFGFLLTAGIVGSLAGLTNRDYGIVGFFLIFSLRGLAMNRFEAGVPNFWE